MTTYSSNAGSTVTVSDKFDSKNTSFRMLLKFDDIQNFLPLETSVSKCGVRLSFTNWYATAAVDVCVMTKLWEKREIVRCVILIGLIFLMSECNV